jgi:putative endonuclease
MREPAHAAPSRERRSVGARGEQIAAEHLKAEGYDVIDRNFRTRAGELDLIAAGDGCLVFCEVRCRMASRRSVGALAGSLESIGPRKRRQLRLMAREWLSAAGGRRMGGVLDLRFDAIGVVLAPDGELVALEHVEDAF